MQPNLPRWSPDGTQIVFMGGRTGLHEGSQVYLVSARGGASRQLTDGRDSTGFDPAWSPDGLSIALSGGFTKEGKTIINLLNLTTYKMSAVPGSTGYYSPRWSPAGRYIAANSSPALFRVRVSDHKVERIFDFKGFHQAVGTFGFWNGLAPDGSPLFQRDLTLDEIYSLEWEAP